MLFLFLMIDDISHSCLFLEIFQILQCRYHEYVDDNIFQWNIMCNNIFLEFFLLGCSVLMKVIAISKVNMTNYNTQR